MIEANREDRGSDKFNSRGQKALMNAFHREEKESKLMTEPYVHRHVSHEVVEYTEHESTVKDEINNAKLRLRIGEKEIDHYENVMVNKTNREDRESDP